MGFRKNDGETRARAHNESDHSKVSRRRLLGLLGCGAAITAAGAYKLLSPSCAFAWPENASAEGRARLTNRQGWTKATQGKSVPSPSAESGRTNQPKLAIARNGDPKQLVDAAIEALGGMRRFVSKGDRVLLKPNIGWDRKPEFAANTNPDAVARVVELCLDAGAKRVTVMDRPCNDPRRSYKNSGIEEAAKKAGAVVVHPDEDRAKSIDFRGEVLKKWEVFDEVLSADVKINMPIAKDHGIAGVTLGMKNWMGCVGGSRGRMHQDIHKSVVDLTAWFKPDLTIIDAYRILVSNGPSGGSVSDVRIAKTLCAGTDPVAVDAFGVSLFPINPEEAEFLLLGEKRGLGKRRLDQIPVREIDLRTVKG